MADLLSNTVGISIFILAFAVLQSGGASVPKRLPMEHSTEAKPVYFVCQNEMLLPLDSSLTDRLYDDLGEPSYSTAKEWVRKFNEKTVGDSFFDVVPQGDARFNRGAFQSDVRLELTAEYRPKPEVGDSIESLSTETSAFHSQLEGLSPTEHFAYFFVYPDSIELFREARDHAKIHFGVGSGWGPMSAGKPIRFILSGGRGGGITPSKQ
ncbi:MAG: hypothetical protein DWQ01_09870 [Planctomycetota bacterium]|nr:MAG: hypothetical protein DWQ01_09870 [Planctomycetota bacterium]